MSQGYSLADIEQMTLRQLFLFARLAVDRLTALNKALKVPRR